MTTADWLRRAADAWAEVEATADTEVRRAKVLIAEGCERLAKHAAFLAEGDAYPPLVGWFSDMKRFVERICLPFGLRFQRLRTAEVPLKPRLPESLVRGLMALLATPLLLLAMLGAAIWVIAAHKRRAEAARRRSRWWFAVDIAAAVLGVGALDLLVDAF